MVLWSACSLIGKSLSFAQILLFLPLALDIAGKDCFLALSAALVIYYGLYSTVQLAVRNTRLSFLDTIFGFFQPFTIPTILIFCFNIYSSSSPAISPVASSLSEGSWLLYVLRRLPNWWETVLRYSSPVFVLLEGISTLLVIQTLGRLSRYYIVEKDESFQFVFLISSASTYVASAYFLYYSYSFAAQEPLSATFIGVSITSVVFLTGIAFAVRNGGVNVVETSLMMAYAVFNIFYLSSDGPSPVAFIRSLGPAAAPLPPVLLESFTAIVSFITQTFGQSLDFISAASSALPLPVIVGLVYRISVLYAASKIIMALKRAKSGFDETTRLSEEEPATRTMTIVVSYSRVTLIAVYTHLLLLNNEGHQVFWRWLNTFLTITLWGVEILLSREDGESDSIVQGFRMKYD